MKPFVSSRPFLKWDLTCQQIVNWKGILSSGSLEFHLADVAERLSAGEVCPKPVQSVNVTEITEIVLLWPY